MGDILIIGGGFAGLEAARLLSKNSKRLNGRRILVVDAKKTFDFLPLLPDAAGGRIRKSNITLDLAFYLEKLKVNFEHGEVVKLDTAAREVILKNGSVLSYEFLIVSCGSVTNFYGLDEFQRHSLKLDSADDAVLLGNTVTTYPAKKIFIIGGGYTGVEIASNLAFLLRRKKIKKYNINIVEKGEDILGPLPEWIKDYCRINLCALRVNIYNSCSIKEVVDKRLKLSNGLEFEDYLIVWSAGVITPSFVQDLKFEKDKQGRLYINENMMFSENCFAVGDSASFKHRGITLRMAVQFSVYEAQIAAKNVLRIIAGHKRLARYRPIDLGFLVPMANKKACGKVLFVRVWGVLGWLLHYAMCIYRSLELKNRFGIFCDAYLRFGR